MKAYYTIEVRDREGKLISRERRRSRSFLKAYNQLIHVFADESNEVIKDIGGTDRTIRVQVTNLWMGGPAGNDDYGIVVGTGTTAVTISDYALGTLIIEGTGSGQLSYLVTTFTNPAVSGSECSFTVARIANNGSGGTITVTEIGIYCIATDTVPATRYICIVRDVLASPQAVPDGGAITVVYTIKVTV